MEHLILIWNTYKKETNFVQDQKVVLLQEKKCTIFIIQDVYFYIKTGILSEIRKSDSVKQTKKKQSLFVPKSDRRRDEEKLQHGCILSAPGRCRSDIEGPGLSFYTFENVQMHISYI